MPPAKKYYCDCNRKCGGVPTEVTRGVYRNHRDYHVEMAANAAPGSSHHLLATAREVRRQLSQPGEYSHNSSGLFLRMEVQVHITIHLATCHMKFPRTLVANNTCQTHLPQSRTHWTSILPAQVRVMFAVQIHFIQRWLITSPNDRCVGFYSNNLHILTAAAWW